MNIRSQQVAAAEVDIPDAPFECKTPLMHVLDVSRLSNGDSIDAYASVQDLKVDVVDGGLTIGGLEGVEGSITFKLRYGL